MSTEVKSSKSPKENTPNGDLQSISLVAISDTHSAHAKVKFDANSSPDIFIHAGDLTNSGTKEELETVIDWLASLLYKPSHLQSELCKWVFLDLFDALNAPVVSISPYLLWLRY